MSVFLVNQYLTELEELKRYGGSKNETSIRAAFQKLLTDYCKQKGFRLIAELPIKTPQGKTVKPDGTVKDSLQLDWGYWESKDETDDIDEEVRKKFEKGYPKDNILFEDSATALLIQAGHEVMRVAMKEPEALDRLITAFISYERPEVKTFREAIEKFKENIPTIANTLREMIAEQQKSNAKFKKASDAFWELCKESINPEITKEDIREMIIQHILTEDIFNTIFDETQFHRENNIAKELMKVEETFFTGNTKRNTLSGIQHYYQVINAAAATIADHHEKQKFLKMIYENFYKAYNPKAADRLGIVYTPNEIVRFMVESTDYLLHKHFGKFLADKDVEILDPATGTGTFITDIIDYLHPSKLEYKYKNEIHANEIAILPYYIANLNIEYTYKQKMHDYQEYENICFVDTLDNLAFGFEGKQTGMSFGLGVENAARIKRQNSKKISVVIGNPPYNAKQENYNFQNANRAYKNIDENIKNTFIKYGTAQNQIVVYDMYTRFYRWAINRLQGKGIIAFITNRSFIDGRAFDGFTKCVQDDFDYIYIIDTKSDVRTNPKIAGTTHNVFGIQTGVAVMFLIKKEKKENTLAVINYTCLDDFWLKEKKLEWFAEQKMTTISFEHIVPDKNNNWINLSDNDFDSLLPVVDKDVKSGKGEGAIFKNFSRGVGTYRDEWVYDLSREHLEDKIKFFVDTYKKTLKNPDYKDKQKIKWDADLTTYLERGIEKKYNSDQIQKATYRPYSSLYFYFDKNFNGRTYQWPEIFRRDVENKFITIPGLASPKDFYCISSKYIVDLNCLAAGCQNLPLNVFDKEDNQVDNITDWGLEQFTTYYQNKKIKKEEIFYYTYAVLHNPAYRKKYELNLKREFPRIPFYTDFAQWVKWGKKLMDLHINYEEAKTYKLKESTIELSHPPKTKLKAVKETGEIVIDEASTLSGVPAAAWDYKLGNRSALEWVLDQYKESKPSDPTIAEKFNTYQFADYKEHVIDLLKKVCTVSVETMKIVTEMQQTEEGK